MLAFLLAVALTSPFVSARAEVIPESSELAVGVVLDRGADVVVAHVIYADNVSDIVSLAPVDGEWRGAFELRPGAVPQIRFEAIFPGNESAVSETTSIVGLGVPMEALLGSDSTEAPVEAESSSPWRLSIALFVGFAVVVVVMAFSIVRRVT